MSEAKKCDRCGKFYSVSSNYKILPKYRIGLNGDGRYSNFQEIDLCSDCMKSLDYFITNNYKTNMERFSEIFIKQFRELFPVEAAIIFPEETDLEKESDKNEC